VACSSLAASAPLWYVAVDLRPCLSKPGLNLPDAGSVQRHDIPAGRVFFVDNGLFFAAHEKTKIKIRPVGGVKATCCSGEGLVMAFLGPAVVFTQSRDPSIFVRPTPASFPCWSCAQLCLLVRAQDPPPPKEADAQVTLPASSDLCFAGVSPRLFFCRASKRRRMFHLAVLRGWFSTSVVKRAFCSLCS
jgi:hypothetical protein